MKLNISYKIFTTVSLLTLAILSFACQRQSAEKSNAAATENTAATAKTAKTIKPESPTEAYKMLYEAVKAKDTEKIKQLVTKSTESLAVFMANTYKQPIEKSYENGFTATTLAPSLPKTRDERIKDNFGALEVYDQEANRWEDLPFMYEDGGWRLAVGNVIQDNTYKSPGKGQAQSELEASNKTIPTAPATGNDKIKGMPPADKPKQ